MLSARTIYTSILVVFVLVGMLFLFVLVRDVYGIDIPAQQRIRSMELLNSLVPIQGALNTCWSARGVLSECPQARQLLVSDVNRDYLLLSNGTLVAVDYRHHVLLMLTPKLDGQQIAWSCWVKSNPSPIKACRSLP